MTDKSEIKRHPFFKGIDWKKMMKREITPPIYLSMEESEENEEVKYLKNMEKVRFKDEDYKEDN